ncbi:alpha/beta fold hydrolase [Rhodospirillaceae bacterium SYSU D60014]|uniref:alpha/beta hydrolase n=1 Tax=Virgifigura deserti TaxID=2268457 RepID=UPI000E6649A5
MPGPLELSGPGHPPADGGSARQLVVLLHGYGADGNDLISLAPHWARLLPGAAFVSPHAPFPCEMGPYGRQWFGFENRDPAALLAGAQAAAGILDGFIDAELARLGLDASRLALVGFSQGAMMALHVALRRPQPVAAVVGYSGALVAPERLAAEITARPPVLLIHGDADQVVPYRALAAARQVLEAAGVPVTAETRPGLPHGIDEAGLTSGGRFLAKAFGVEGD